MTGVDVETFRWTMSAVFQGVAALTAVVGIFLVFLLSDRVTRRNDVLLELKVRLSAFCKTMSDWKKLDDVHQDVAIAVARELKSQRNDLADCFAAGDCNGVHDFLTWKWNRYGLAKKAADRIYKVWLPFEKHLTDDDNKVVEELDFARRMAVDLESALDGMKMELVVPGVFSAMTMAGSIGSLSLTDMIFSSKCSQTPTYVLISIMVLLVLTLISTGSSVKRLVVDWDQ